jgi:hypothetical protein
MMKAVMRELAQAKRHYSKLPFFEFLRCESIAPRDRLAFFPGIAPFVLAFSDLNRFVLRDESSKDPHQQLVNAYTREEDHHWPWYLEDLVKLGHDRSSQVTQVLRSYMKDDTQHSRMLAARLAQILVGATPVEKLVVVEAVAQTGQVFFGITAKLAEAIRADGGPELRYLGRFHFAREIGHAMQGLDHRVLESVQLTEFERVRCLDLCFRVFDLFADWSIELLAYARNVLAQNAVHRNSAPIPFGRTA